MKRKEPPSISTGKNVKVSGREVVLPALVPGRGMSCGQAGIPRYMKKAKARFDDQGIVTAFINYNMATGRHSIYKNIGAIVKAVNTPNAPTNSRITPTNQPHFIMAGIHNESGGHAISILVDPPSRKMWIFDPWGNQVLMNPYSLAIQTDVLPIIRRMWKIPPKNMIFYRGPNLQASNNRGTCTTFYVTFMDIIPHLLAGTVNLKNVERFAGKNSIAVRKFYLDFAPETPGLIVARNVRLRN